MSERLCEKCARAFVPARKSRRFCSRSCSISDAHRRRERPNLSQRYWRRVVVRDGCWGWMGHHDRLGYAHLGALRAYRVAYEVAFGPIPPGLMVRHLCNNPGCVRPDHLAVGTQLDNMRDMVRAGRSTAGERSAAAKLTAGDVREMRRAFGGGVSQGALAKRFGISQSNVSRIVRHLAWPGVRGA